jgi:glucokinase
MSDLLIEVGATHTRARIISSSHNIDFELVFNTCDFNSSNELIRKVISKSKKKNFGSIRIAVAGLHSFESITMTHTKLSFNKLELEQEFNTRFFLCNDVYAQALALNESKFSPIRQGIPQGFTKVIISIGTGLGVACSYFKEGKNIILSTEAGHCLFNAQSEEDEIFCEITKTRLSKHFIEWEDVISGKGIENIYFFVSGKILSAQEISILEVKDSFAKQTFELFFKYLARFAQQCTLEYLAQAGVYFSGGVIGKHSQFDVSSFKKEFSTHSSFEQLLRDVPLFLTQDDFLGLEGLASVALSK